MKKFQIQKASHFFYESVDSWELKFEFRPMNGGFYCVEPEKVQGTFQVRGQKFNFCLDEIHASWFAEEGLPGISSILGKIQQIFWENSDVSIAIKINLSMYKKHAYKLLKEAFYHKSFFITSVGKSKKSAWYEYDRESDTLLMEVEDDKK